MEQNVLVSKARAVNSNHLLQSVTLFAVLSVCVAAAPASAAHGSSSSMASSVLHYALLLLNLSARLLFYVTILLLPVLGYNTLSVPRSKLKKRGDGDGVEEARKSYSQYNKYGGVLSEVIQLETVSYDETSDEKTDYGKFRRMHELLKQKFPLVHEKLEVSVVNDHSLVYKWQGTDKSLKPIMLCAHLDVVPAPGEWKQPAFGGNIVDGVVWGRGAIDNKHNVVGQLGAVEELLKEEGKSSGGKGREKNRRTVYIAFGHDEEVSEAKIERIEDRANRRSSEAKEVRAKEVRAKEVRAKEVRESL
jgi:hypothetical protein